MDTYRLTITDRSEELSGDQTRNKLLVSIAVTGPDAEKVSRDILNNFDQHYLNYCDVSLVREIPKTVFETIEHRHAFNNLLCPICEGKK
jgi:hypothetical protein